MVIELILAVAVFSSALIGAAIGDWLGRFKPWIQVCVLASLTGGLVWMFIEAAKLR